MKRATVLFMIASLGIQFGWREYRQGEMEYIVQVDDGVIEALRNGQAITSAIPVELHNVRRIRIQYGSDPVPQPELPARTSGPGDHATGHTEPQANALRSSEIEIGGSTPIPVPGASNQQDQDPRRNGGVVARIPSDGGQSGRSQMPNHAPPLRGPELGGPQLGGNSTPVPSIPSQALGNGRLPQDNPAIADPGPMNNIDPIDDPTPNRRLEFSGNGNRLNLGAPPTGAEDRMNSNPQIHLPMRTHGLSAPPVADHRAPETDLNRELPGNTLTTQTNDRSANVSMPAPQQEESGSPVSAAQQNQPGGNDLESGDGALTASEPWLMTFFLLCLSMGANVYLAWMARGFYVRYAALMRDSQRSIARAA